MSNFYGKLGKIGKKIAPYAAGAAGFMAAGPAGAIAGYSAAKAATASKSDGGVLPAPPTIDEAVQNTSELDRLKRRKGVLANIYAGSTASPNPAVGKTTLGGT